MHKLLTLGLASLFLVVTGCQDTNTTGPLVGPSFHEGGVDDDGVLSVEGEGDVIDFLGRLEPFSLDATKRQDGSVRGQGVVSSQIFNPDFDFINPQNSVPSVVVRGNITCMVLLESGIVVMGTDIGLPPNPPPDIGVLGMVFVRDNGELDDGDPPDRINFGYPPSFIVGTDPDQACETALAFETVTNGGLTGALDGGIFFDINSGDIEVEVEEDDNDDDDVAEDGEGREVEAGGEEIIRPLFGNPFTTLNYSFEVESEDGEVEGEISGRGEGPGGIFVESRGIVTCITVEPDGVTARMGGLITQSESNVTPDATGQEAIWTVVAGEDGSARSTFIFISGAFPGLAQFHCAVGVNPDVLGGLVPVSADIEVD